MIYYVLHNYCQLMGLPPPPKGVQEYPLCCVKGQVPLLHEGQVTSHHGEAMPVTFSQIESLSVPTPFDVLHEHFGNIGAL
jgi:hypothetical protein